MNGQEVFKDVTYHQIEQRMRYMDKMMNSNHGIATLSNVQAIGSTVVNHTDNNIYGTV